MIEEKTIFKKHVSLRDMVVGLASDINTQANSKEKYIE